jgi:hypothetical protein
MTLRVLVPLIGVLAALAWSATLVVDRPSARGRGSPQEAGAALYTPGHRATAVEEAKP